MKTQGGFTLIELLVVIAILAVLFGVTALALNGVGANAGTVTQSAEKDVVQTAVDVYMTTNNVTTLAVQNTSVAVGQGSIFGAYLRRTSKFFYCWTTNGVVGQATTLGVACP